jgi:small subunit ribosomal protein S6
LISLGAIPWKGGFKMRDYELVLIVHPDLDEAAVNETLDKVKGWINEADGQVVKTDLWGKRRLAYPVRKQHEGQYVLIELKAKPTFTAPLERNLRFLEPVLRFSLIFKE